MATTPKTRTPGKKAATTSTTAQPKVTPATEAKLAPETAAPAAPITAMEKTVTPVIEAAVNNTVDMFAFPKVEMPTAFREMTETTVERSKEAYSMFKTNAEEATSALEASIEKNRANAFEFNKKTMEVAQENTEAAIAHAKDVMAVKSFSEAIELQSAFIKKQTQVAQNQMKSFQDLAKRITDEAAEPYKAALVKTAESFKVAS